MYAVHLFLRVDFERGPTSRFLPCEVSLILAPCVASFKLSQAGRRVDRQ
jgi:hypothetical protein